MFCVMRGFQLLERGSDEFQTSFRRNKKVIRVVIYVSVWVLQNAIPMR